ncbi:hypothetical protein DPMN_047782 [Dreissena polymorpha]|uniref:DUF6589 domain-containing protein n=1 Tax=Dreissena polymorpha TaxID=45954 RepID=A0A9D4DAD2_DREPO|nr:hypothetical protein DPMN_047782 [Dreissena polymorpha]
MIGCECRSQCAGGDLFHYACIGVDPDNIPSPWYCSSECKNRQIVPYQDCDCRIDLGTHEPIIGCAAETMCKKVEWYHIRCFGIYPKNPPKGRWFCTDDCRSMMGKKGKVEKKRQDVRPNVDFKQNYTKSILWCGLNLLCRRDAVREADGQAMLTFWKFDLVHFFWHRHPKYVILAHRPLAAVNGWLPEKLRHDLIHNRTVNYAGGVGRNLPMDFMNEILNRLFKDLLDAAKGRYTDLTIQRCSQIIGPLGGALDSVFDSNVIQHEIYRHRYRDCNRDTNVSRIIELLHDEQLFTNVPARYHNAFPGYVYNINPKQPGGFAAKIKQLSLRLDRLKKVVIDSK